jgi:hypothetical protein
MFPIYPGSKPVQAQTDDLRTLLVDVFFKLLTTDPGAIPYTLSHMS